LIAGSIGPLGKYLKPLGEIEPEQARVIFRNQVDNLVAGGVDLIILETFSNIEEMLLAIDTVKSATDIPVLAQMTFSEDGLTATGDTPKSVASRLTEAGADAIGTNCGLGSQRTLEIVTQLIASTSLPVSAQPNAGYPERLHGRLVYLSTPSYMAGLAVKMAEAGCRIIGGCCGTTPEHIKAISESLREFAKKGPAVRGKETLVIPASPKTEIPAKKRVEPGSFAARLGREFIISVEVDPPKGANPEKILTNVHKLKEAGIDAVNIADSPMARVRMSAHALGYLIKQQVGLEIILHLTTRDHNLIGLQAELLGFHAMGIRNILAITGDPPPVTAHQSTGVFDVDSIGLLHIIAQMNRGTDSEGNPIGQPTNFTAGAALNPMAQDLEREIKRFREKLEAGAAFAMTQPVYDLELWNGFLDRLGDPVVPILFGVLPLHSFRHAEFLHNEVPGISIPVRIRRRLLDAGDKALAEGISIAREIIEKVAPTVQGIYLMPSFGRYENVLAAVEDLLSNRPSLKSS